MEDIGGRILLLLVTVMILIICMASDTDFKSLQRRVGQLEVQVQQCKEE